MFNIFNGHKHEFHDKELLYSVDKDIAYSSISDFGFTRTYRVQAVQVQECDCGKIKKNIIIKNFYQHNPLDKNRFLSTIRELLEKGYKETNLL